MGDQTVGTEDAESREIAVREPGVQHAGAFDFLLTAPQPASGTAPRSAGEQHAPSGTVFDFSERAHRRKPRATAPDWVAFVLAFLLPPVGFIVSIAVRIWSSRRNGWTTRLVRAATTISIILSIVLGIALVVVSAIAADEAEEARVAAAAQPLCEALDATPGILDLPGFGWPTERVAIPQTLEAMRLYQAQWTALADVAPSTIASGVSSIAGAAQTLISSVESTQVLDRQRNLDQMSTITAQSGLVAWYSARCSGE